MVTTSSVKRVKRCWKLLVAVVVYLFAIFSFVLPVKGCLFFMHLCAVEALLAP